MKGKDTTGLLLFLLEYPAGDLPGGATHLHLFSLCHVHETRNKLLMLTLKNVRKKKNLS